MPAKEYVRNNISAVYVICLYVLTEDVGGATGVVPITVVNLIENMTVPGELFKVYCSGFVTNRRRSGRPKTIKGQFSRPFVAIRPPQPPPPQPGLYVTPDIAVPHTSVAGVTVDVPTRPHVLLIGLAGVSSLGFQRFLPLTHSFLQSRNTHFFQQVLPVGETTLDGIHILYHIFAPCIISYFRGV